MKIIFFGTGQFSLTILKKLVGSRHQVIAMVTQPDKKKGRGQNVQPALLKAFAGQAAPGVSVFQPEGISSSMFLDSLKQKNADIFIVVDYGRFFRKELLNMPKKYCINLHPSLLPKYRGAAPVNWALLNGETQTGNTIIKMTERMDAGDIILQQNIAITMHDDAVSLSQKLSQNGAELILNALELIEKGKEQFTKQDEPAATYAPKLEKWHGEIDWSSSAVEIDRKIRGLKPWPGAYSHLNGKVLKVLNAEIIDFRCDTYGPGTVCDETRLVISTGNGAIRLSELQLEGKKIMKTHNFLLGVRLKNGTKLG